MAKKIINVVYNVDDKELRDTKKHIQDVEKETKKSEAAMVKMGNSGSEAFGLIKGALAAISIAALAKQIFDITAEFQKLNAVLTNTLGSQSEAKKALKDIQDFASKTPFSVVQLTQSFVKLANQGFRPTVEELRKLGDIASSQGKEFDQLTEAIIDAQTGEFERLKEFGIRASKEGDNVTFTFKGIETQTKFTSEAIRGYILSLGDAAGVSGSMAAISETLSGKVSNLGDNFDALFNGIGQEGSGVLGVLLDQLNEALGKLNEFIREAQRDILDETVTKQVDAFKKPLESAFDAFKKSGGTAVDELNSEFKVLIDNINQISRENDAFQKDLATQTGEQFEYTNFQYQTNLKVQKELILLKEQYLQKIQQERDNIANRIEQDRIQREQLSQLRVPIEEIKIDYKELEQLANNWMKAQEGVNQAIIDAEKDMQATLEDIGREEISEADAREQELASMRVQRRREAANQIKAVEQELTDFLLGTAQQVFTALLTGREEDFADQEAYYERQKLLAGDNERAKAEIQLREDQQREALRKREKERQKQDALINIAIDTAVNVIRSIANNGGIPLGLPFGALALAAGGVQAALVRKYRKGEVNIDGPGTTTSDSIPAMISRGESVINAEATAKSSRLLEAINDRKIDDRILTQIAKDGGSSVAVFDDSRIVKAIEDNRVDFIKQGYSLWQVNASRAGFKQILRAKIIN